MRRQIGHILLVVLFFAVRSGWSQAATPEEALQALITADNLEEAVKYLSPAAKKIVKSLSPEDKREFADRILPSKWLKARRLKLVKADDGGWLLLWKGERPIEKISLVNTMTSGVDALLLFQQAGHLGAGGQTLVSMRWEDDEWRLTGIGAWDPMRIGSDEVLRRLTPNGKNETAAVDTLGEIHSAVYEYARKHPNMGFPTSLQALAESTDGGDDEQDDTVQVDPSLLAVPLIKDGYQFHYTLLDPGSEGAQGQFEITAVPLQFGKTGERSFLADESLTIRFTDSDRPANQNDAVLGQPSAMESRWPGITITMPCAVDY
jgi:hypothetical protein